MTASVSPTQLQDFVRDNLLNGRAVAEDEDLLLSGLLDSLGVMALVTFIEEQRGAVIPPEDVTLENFTSIATIVSYLTDG